jgi:dihydroflavonol-4-reductase
MRVLVTGATGFLGSWVARALLEAGDQPLALVRKSSRLDALQGLSVKIIEGDVLDRGSVERAVKRVEAVIHVAGLVSLRRRDQESLVRVNVDGTRNVLEAAAAAGLRALHTSTIATIGFHDRPVVLDERAQLSREQASQYPYAASKLAAEEIALHLARSGGDVLVFNPGLLLGPGDVHLSSTRFVHHYLRREALFCPAGGTSLGDVRRIAAVYPQALRLGQRGERYILAGLNHTYREVFASLARISGLPPPWPLPTLVAQWWGLASDTASLFVRHPFEEFSLGTVAYATRFNYCDCTKATSTFGYMPGELDPLIQETVADHSSRGSLAGSDPATAGGAADKSAWR